MMKRSHWPQFIGLPHRTGADPRVEDAADCVLVAFAVLDELKQPRPPLDPSWFKMAAQGMWTELGKQFEALTAEDDGAPGAVAMTQSGLVVSVGGGILIVQHDNGVRWVPMELLRKLQWRRFR